jgi:hypothetical protein
VRHPLVQKIVVAYEERDARSQASPRRKAVTLAAGAGHAPPGAEPAAEATLATLDRVESCSRTRRARAATRSCARIRSCSSCAGSVQRRRRRRRAVWDKKRDLFAPWTEKLATAEARLILVGSPRDPDPREGAELGLAAILPAEPSHGEFAVALHQAFEFMDVKARSESRGKWLNRYRYELGELIDIARALTTEREIDKLLG